MEVTPGERKERALAFAKEISWRYRFFKRELPMLLKRDPVLAQRFRSFHRKEEVRKVLDAGGKLSASQALRCRIRYLNDGVALGSKGFIEKIFQSHRNRFGAKRKEGSRKLRSLPWNELHTMRDLRKEPISVP